MTEQRTMGTMAVALAVAFVWPRPSGATEEIWPAILTEGYFHAPAQYWRGYGLGRGLAAADTLQDVEAGKILSVVQTLRALPVGGRLEVQRGARDSPYSLKMSANRAALDTLARTGTALTPAKTALEAVRGANTFVFEASESRMVLTVGDKDFRYARHDRPGSAGLRHLPPEVRALATELRKAPSTTGLRFEYRQAGTSTLDTRLHDGDSDLGQFILGRFGLPVASMVPIPLDKHGGRASLLLTHEQDGLVAVLSTAKTAAHLTFRISQRRHTSSQRRPTRVTPVSIRYTKPEPR